jgi:hypothetical protein
MRPVRVTVNTVAASDPIVMDVNEAPFAASVSVKVTGTITYSVQHTFDDPFASGGLASAVWFDIAAGAAMTAATTNKDSNYAFPVTAIRLNVTAVTGGSATMTVIQAGPL